MNNKTAASLTAEDFRNWLDTQEPARIIAVIDTDKESPLSTFATEILGQRTYVTIDGISESFEGRTLCPLCDWMHRFTLYFDAALLTRATVKQVRSILDRAIPRHAQMA